MPPKGNLFISGTNLQVCCSINETKKQCGDFAKDGFSCVEKSQCNEITDIGPREKTPLEITGYNALCADSSHICCHENEMTPIQKSCSDFQSNGYRLSHSQKIERKWNRNPMEIEDGQWKLG